MKNLLATLFLLFCINIVSAQESNNVRILVDAQFQVNHCVDLPTTGYNTQLDFLCALDVTTEGTATNTPRVWDCHMVNSEIEHCEEEVWGLCDDPQLLPPFSMVTCLLAVKVCENHNGTLVGDCN